VDQAARREADAELEDLRSSAARVQDVVLGDVGGSSLMSVSISAVMERLEGWIDGVVANGVCWDPTLRWLPPCCSSQSWTLT
jgi:hypothetical protein